MDVSFTGISGVTVLFELLSIGFTPRLNVVLSFDHVVFIHIECKVPSLLSRTYNTYLGPTYHLLSTYLYPYLETT
jgi:hypothetical protein